MGLILHLLWHYKVYESIPAARTHAALAIEERLRTMRRNLELI